MTTITKRVLTCDGCGLDPEEVDEEVREGWITAHRLQFDSDVHEIDLCQPCLEDERKRNSALGEWVNRSTIPTNRARSMRKRRRAADIRAWAVRKGYTIGPRGRIPMAVTIAYEREELG